MAARLKKSKIIKQEGQERWLKLLNENRKERFSMVADANLQMSDKR